MDYLNGTGLEGVLAMMDSPIQLVELMIPLSLIAGSLLVGLLFNKIVLPKLQTMAARTRWTVDEAVVNSLQRMPVLWFVLLGTYTAMLGMPIKPEWAVLLKKALLIVAILSVTVVGGRIAVGLIRVYAKNVQGVLPGTSLFANLARLFVFLIGILVLLQSLKISITPILTALGVGGLAVALALQETLSNLFAGLQIVASGQVKVGDYVKLDSGEEGYVADITWRNTSIRALPNNMIIVPNSKVASALVTNYYQPEKEMSVLVQVGVGYQSDLNKVERVTIEQARETLRNVSGGVQDFEPFIRYHTFDNSSINFSVILRAKEFTDQFLLKHEFVKALHERYQKENIEIPFPQRTLHLRREENG